MSTEQIQEELYQRLKQVLPELEQQLRKQIQIQVREQYQKKFKLAAAQIQTCINSQLQKQLQQMIAKKQQQIIKKVSKIKPSHQAMIKEYKKEMQILQEKVNSLTKQKEKLQKHLARVQAYNLSLSSQKQNSSILYINLRSYIQKIQNQLQQFRNNKTQDEQIKSCRQYKQQPSFNYPRLMDKKDKKTDQIKLNILNQQSVSLCSVMSPPGLGQRKILKDSTKKYLMEIIKQRFL